MTGIHILVDNCSGKKKSIVMICFIRMVKEIELSGTATLHLYIKGHTNNDCDHVFNSLKLLYRKKMSLILRITVKFWIPEILLKLFKCSIKTSLDCNHSWMISMTYLILKLSTSIMSFRWKIVVTHWLLSRLPWWGRV